MRRSPPHTHRYWCRYCHRLRSQHRRDIRIPVPYRCRTHWHHTCPGLPRIHPHFRKRPHPPGSPRGRCRGRSLRYPGTTRLHCRILSHQCLTGCFDPGTIDSLKTREALRAVGTETIPITSRTNPIEFVDRIHTGRVGTQNRIIGANLLQNLGGFALIDILAGFPVPGIPRFAKARVGAFRVLTRGRLSAGEFPG